VLALCFFGAAALTTRAGRSESLPPREDLAALPLEFERWTGRDAPQLPDDVVAVLGADDYVNRVYVAGHAPVGLFVGYYESQRQGDTIHSPLNCLPGAGWQPMSRSIVSIPVAGQPPVTANRILIQKGLERQVVLYWYQSQGRTIASEYWGKVYLVYDALRRNRSDAAMVRVVTPVLVSESTDAPADARALAFVQTLAPALNRFLPS
jgi:EpsI family protein